MENCMEGENKLLTLPVHTALGKGVGTNPGRVVWAYSPEAVKWDGSGFWWKKENFQEKKIMEMVRDSIRNLSGKPGIKEGWKELFRYINRRKTSEDRGYAKGEKIAIKVNMNGAGGYDWDKDGVTKLGFINPILLKCILFSLVCDAEIPPENITVYDASRIFPEFMLKMLGEGVLAGIHVLFRDANGTHNARPDQKKPVRWSAEFEGEVNYLPECVSEASYVINMANLKAHPYGVTLCAKNHFGTIINSNRYRPPEGANIHQFMENQKMGQYTVLTDLIANKDLYEKTVLYLLDGLICAYNVDSEITKESALWRQPPFNGNFTSSIFMSQDPVAIDSVGIDFLANEPVICKYNPPLIDNFGVENYLHEAALAPNPPSGTHYQNGSDQLVKSLGVHEHWNNVQDKQYGRNLGKEDGIELIKI